MYATRDTEDLLKMMASSDPEALPNYLRATLPELNSTPSHPTGVGNRRIARDPLVDAIPNAGHPQRYHSSSINGDVGDVHAVGSTHVRGGRPNGDMHVRDKLASVALHHRVCMGADCGHTHHNEHELDDDDDEDGDAHLEHMYDFVDDDAGVDLGAEQLPDPLDMPSPGLPADEHLHRLVRSHHSHRTRNAGANVIGVNNTSSVLPSTGPSYKGGQLQRHALQDGHNHNHAHPHRQHQNVAQNFGGHAHAPPSAASTVAGKDLEAMSTFFVEQLRLKDPVKSALAFHDQGIVSLKAWVSKSEEERARVVNVLKQVGVVAGDRSKLRKVTYEQISEWSRSKANPPVPSVLPHQRQSKEEMEAILASGANEYLIARDLVGLGLRGIYGGAMELFSHRVPDTAGASGGDTGARREGKQSASGGDGAERTVPAPGDVVSHSPNVDGSAACEERDLHDVKIQATIYRMCARRSDERKMLHHLLAHMAPAGEADGGQAETDRAAYTQRLVTLDREEAMLGGARKCLSSACDTIESADKRFEMCSRCKIAGYCSRACQKSDWKSHAKFCIAAPDTSNPAR
eukprot:m.95444 g.95444  ORF g.95444 m.95444 type:complete len:573 (+) comp16594_c0_seq5:409-2127(+)